MTEVDQKSAEIPEWLIKFYEARGVPRDKLKLDADAIARAEELGLEKMKDLIERGTPSDVVRGDEWRGKTGTDGAIELEENLQRIAHTGGLEEWDPDQPQTRTSEGSKDNPGVWVRHELKSINHLSESSIDGDNNGEED